MMSSETGFNLKMVSNDQQDRDYNFAKMTISPKSVFLPDKSSWLLKDLSTNQQRLILVCVFISSNYFKTLMLARERRFNLVLFCTREIEVNKPTKNIVTKSLLSIYCLLVFRFYDITKFLFSARIVDMQMNFSWCPLPL